MRYTAFYMAQMSLSEELKWRGFVQQTTLENLKKLDSRHWIAYHGYDASTDSLTVGNLAALMLDKCFMRHGHKVILLAGGATSLIGDPGGKDSERPLQTEETVRFNVASVKKQIEHLFGSTTPMVNNLDWFKDARVLPFLRDIGKHFSMTPLVQRDYIASRMGKSGGGISYAEFSYTIIQGYDYLHLYRSYGTEIQLGGSDQWGNCISGVDLIRRVTGKTVHALASPLIINKATGKKFGKSEAGAVWLGVNKTSAYQFYQFWLNADDEGVESYLKVFTELDKDAIAAAMSEFRKNKRERYAQKLLAQWVTTFVHGKDRADKARTATDAIVGKKHIGEVGQSVVTILKHEIPHVNVHPGVSLAAVLVSSGLAKSNSEARRLLTSGAIYVNEQSTAADILVPEDFKQGRLLIRRGKAYKDTALVEVV